MVVKMSVFSSLDDEKIVLGSEGNADKGDDVDAQNAENLDQEHGKKRRAPERREPGRFEESEQAVTISESAKEGDEESEDEEKDDVVGGEALSSEAEFIEIVLEK